jgi:hypothetical protein
MNRGLLFLVLLVVAQPAQAQPSVPPCNPAPKTYIDLWCSRIGEIKNARAGFRDGFRDDIERAVRLNGRNLPAFLLFAQARSRAIDLKQVEDARIDKQVGAPGNTAGSTSAVSKGSVPSILGFAVENGALTQSAEGTKVTLRGTLVGWLDLLQNQGFIASYEDDAAFTRQLRRVSYSLTLNTDTTVTPQADSSGGLSLDAVRKQIKQTDQQLSGYSVRLAILDKRDPRDAVNRRAVATVLDTQGVALLKSDDPFEAFFNSAEYEEKWKVETTDLLADTNRTLSDDDIERVLYRQLEAVRLLMIDRIPQFDERVAGFLRTLQSFDKARVRVFEEMQKRPLVALEYVNAREVDVPDRHTVRFIAEGQMGPRLDLTANVSWTMQSALPSAVASDSGLGLRDFQAAAQLDIPLADAQKRVASGTGIGTPVFGIAYLSQKLTERASVTFAGQSFALDPGWIHVVQARVSIPVKGSGLKVPLSLSLANRTELIREKTLRGHIGLTFDMDVLSALIK